MNGPTALLLLLLLLVPPSFPSPTFNTHPPPHPSPTWPPLLRWAAARSIDASGVTLTRESSLRGLAAARPFAPRDVVLTVPASAMLCTSDIEHLFRLGGPVADWHFPGELPGTRLLGLPMLLLAAVLSSELSLLEDASTGTSTRTNATRTAAMDGGSWWSEWLRALPSFDAPWSHPLAPTMGENVLRAAGLIRSSVAQDTLCDQERLRWDSRSVSSFLRDLFANGVPSGLGLDSGGGRGSDIGSGHGSDSGSESGSGSGSVSDIAATAAAAAATGSRDGNGPGDNDSGRTHTADGNGDQSRLQQERPLERAVLRLIQSMAPRPDRPRTGERKGKGKGKSKGKRRRKKKDARRRRRRQQSRSPDLDLRRTVALLMSRMHQVPRRRPYSFSGGEVDDACLVPIADFANLATRPSGGAERGDRERRDVGGEMETSLHTTTSNIVWRFDEATQQFQYVARHSIALGEALLLDYGSATQDRPRQAFAAYGLIRTAAAARVGRRGNSGSSSSSSSSSSSVGGASGAGDVIVKVWAAGGKGGGNGRSAYDQDQGESRCDVMGDGASPPMINYFDEEDMMRMAVIQATDEQSSAAASSYSGGGGGGDGGVGEDGYISILLPEMRVLAWCPQFEDGGAGENDDTGDAACNSVGAGNSDDADDDDDDDAVSLAPPHCAQDGDGDRDEEKKKTKKQKQKKARDQLAVRLGKLWDDLRSVGAHIAGERGAAAGVEVVVGEGSADSAAQTTLLVAGLQAVGAACEKKASFLLSDRKATSAKKNTTTGEATASILPPVEAVESAVRVLVGRAAVDALVDAEIQVLGFYGQCLRAMAARVEEEGGGVGVAAGRWELCCSGSVLFGAVDDGG